MDKTTLLFIRHGESLQNRGDITHEMDCGLTELGWRQAMLVADWLARSREIHAVISSSMRRSRQTAELIGRRMGLPVTVQPGLEEATRRYWDELPAAHQSSPLAAWDDCWLPTDENAPAYAEFRSRLRNALADILEAHAGRTVAVVSHGGSIGTILRSLFSGHSMPVFTQNTGVTELTWSDNRWQLTGQNLQEHLSPLLMRPSSGSAPVSERFPWNGSAETQAVQSFYRAVVRATPAAGDSNTGDLEQLVRLALARPVQSILDVGCGAGALALACAPRVPRVIGLDASTAMLERAELRRLEANCANLDLIWGHAADLPLPAASLDLITSRDLWGHLRTAEGYLAESKRVLRAGGYLLADEAIGSADPVKRASQEAIEIRRNPAFARLWTLADIQRVLTESSFHDEQTDVYQTAVKLEDWMSAIAADEGTRSDVRNMLEAGMDEDATGLRVRRDRDGHISFSQTRVRLLARTSLAPVSPEK